jgi:hypothetical protein
LKESWRSNLAELKQRLVLTREEMRVIVFIVTAAALGLTARLYRDMHPPPLPKVDKKHLSSRIKASSPSPSSQPRRTKPDTEKEDQDD